jgi:hypothetical protein
VFSSCKRVRVCERDRETETECRHHLLEERLQARLGLRVVGRARAAAEAVDGQHAQHLAVVSAARGQEKVNHKQQSNAITPLITSMAQTQPDTQIVRIFSS